MKKFLSLVLALVMTMSLVTVSAGAKEFKDDSKINYDEAVAVISAVKVVDGYADGSFNPQGQLTRGAAAKIICNLILTPTTAAELPTNVAPYKDVPANHTFAGYIAYCQEKGIISGYADGTFKPAAPLTSYAFMKMLLGALGYSSDAEGYTGANWAINVAKQALGIGLADGLKTNFVGTKPVSREEAALYAFNTLKATMVEYPEKTTVTMGDATVTLSGKAQDVEWGTGTLNDGKVEKDGFVQFGEKYFAKLVREDDTDAFGRPANKWAYDKKDIGTYVDYTKMVAEYTTEVEGGDVYSDITSAAADYDLYYFQDGVQMDKAATKKQASQIAKKNDEPMGETGNGVLTQVYVDNDAEELTIVEINTYLAETDDYNEKKETLKLSVFGDVTVKTLELEDLPAIEKYEDGDLVLITVADGVVQSIVDPESVKGVEIEEFAKKDYVVADEKYAYALTGAQDYSMGSDKLNDYDKEGGNLDGKTFDLYFDTYGYLIGLKQVEEDVDYVFITGYDLHSSNLVNKTATANAIFEDGTTKEIEVKNANKLWNGRDGRICNTWYSYSVKNDVYTLTYAENQLHVTDIEKIDSKHVHQKQPGTELYYYGNADTNYIVAKLGEVEGQVVIAGVESVTTGVKNVSLNVWDKAKVEAEAEGTVVNSESQGVYTVFNKSGAYIRASIVIGDDGAISDRYAYMYGEPNHEKYNKSEDVYTWEMDAVINGEKTTVTFKSDLPFTDAVKNSEGFEDLKYFENGALVKLDIDKDGYAVGATQAHGVTFEKWTLDDEIIENRDEGMVTLTAEGDTLWVTSQKSKRGFALADECPAVIIVEKADEKDHSVKAVEEYTTVAKAIRALDNYDGKNTANFDGTIYIFFKDGIATSVILTDTVEAKAPNKNDATVEGVKAELFIGERGNLSMNIANKGEKDEVSYKVIATDIRSGNSAVVNGGKIAGNGNHVVLLKDRMDGTMAYSVQLTVNGKTATITL